MRGMMSTHEEQAREVYGKLYIDEHGDVTTKERDIAIIAAALLIAEAERLDRKRQIAIHYAHVPDPT